MPNETLGTSFSIDISDLKAGLAQANRLIRESESEFREAAAGMDDWTESQEGLTARQKTLNKQIDIQKAKVSALTKEKARIIAEMKKEGKTAEEIAKATDALNNSITRESKQLDKLQGELNKTEKALNDVGKESKETGKGFEGLKKAGSIAVGAIAAVAAACVAAVGAFLGLAESTRDFRRDMAQFSQNADTAGVSLDKMKAKMREVSSVTGDADAALEGMNMLMATGLDTGNIEKAADALTGAANKFDGLKFEGLAEGLQETLATGVAVGPFAELIERTGGDLEAFNAGLANCTTEAQRQAYAMNFLTKSGLIEANEAYKEMNKDLVEAEKAQGRLTEATATLGAIAEPIMTTIKNLSADLLESITPFVGLIGTGLSGAMNGTAGAADSLADGLSGILDTALTAVTDTVPVLVDTVVGIIPKILDTLLSKTPEVLTMLSGMVVSVVNGLSAMLPQVIGSIMQVLPLLINSLLSAVPQLLQAAVTLLMAIVQAVPVIVQQLLSALPSVIQTLITALVDSIPILTEAAVQLLMAIVQAIPVILDALIANLPLIIDALITGLLNALPLLLNAAVTLLFAIIDAIPQIVASLYQKMPQIVTAIVSSLAKAIPQVLKSATSLLDQILNAAGDLIAELPSKMGEVIAAMVTGLTEGISSIKTIGSDIVKGLWEGISDMTGWIGEKISGFGESVLGGLKSFFGIKSPSKVMADIVGKNLALGIGEGFTDNIGEVNSDIESAFDFKPPRTPGGANNGTGGLASGSPGGVVVYQTNHYSQPHSRFEIWQSQQDTAAAVKLALMGG